jgi:hypothetical protein
MPTSIFDTLSSEAKLKQLNLSLDFIDEKIYGALTVLGINPDTFSPDTWVRDDETHTQHSHGAFFQDELERNIQIRSFILSKRAAL